MSPVRAQSPGRCNARSTSQNYSSGSRTIGTQTASWTENSQAKSNSNENSSSLTERVGRAACLTIAFVALIAGAALMETYNSGQINEKNNLIKSINQTATECSNQVNSCIKDLKISNSAVDHVNKNIELTSTEIKDLKNNFTDAKLLNEQAQNTIQFLQELVNSLKQNATWAYEQFTNLTQHVHTIEKHNQALQGNLSVATQALTCATNYAELCVLNSTQQDSKIRQCFENSAN